MKLMKIKAVIIACAISTSASIVMAQQSASMEGHDHMNHGAIDDHSNHDKMADHSTMGKDMSGGQMMAEGVGIIHRVSRLNRTVNLTHEPIPALKWPEMTMDLPVAKSVDISHLKSGDKVMFKLELGKDKQYIITHIMK